MSSPILCYVQGVQKLDNKSLVLALVHPSQVFSSVTFKCTFEKTEDMPWGVNIQNVHTNIEGAVAGFFSNRNDAFYDSLVKAFSSLLNGFYGANEREGFFVKNSDIEQVFGTVLSITCDDKKEMFLRRLSGFDKLKDSVSDKHFAQYFATFDPTAIEKSTNWLITQVN